ncbi:MAG: type II toxin-antitoxin system VapC family toxin [Treponema sp.]|nr:type II toxin-antitoxin system VapC family toxin [Treponema sp.]
MTRFLLDTNALIWLFEGSPRMKPVLPLFSMKNSKVYISAASWWEIAIKERKEGFSFTGLELESFVNMYDFHELPVTREQFRAYKELPKIHNDPFDHMLLAQAITCPMRLITGDKILAEYSSLVMVI